VEASTNAISREKAHLGGTKGGQYPETECSNEWERKEEGVQEQLKCLGAGRLLRTRSCQIRGRRTRSSWFREDSSESEEKPVKEKRSKQNKESERG